MAAGALPESFCEGFHEADEVRKMAFRRMPHYGLVSIISFGASGLGGMFTAGQGKGIQDAVAGVGNDTWFAEDAEEDKQRARDIVHLCLKRGVNMIDTSHWYGQGRSERLLGHALQGVPRKAFYLNSKIGRYDQDPLKMFDFSYAKTYQAVKDTLKRLQLDYIDSMQIHDPEFIPDRELLFTQTLPALQRCKEEGMIKYIGMTGYPLEMQRDVIERSAIKIDTSLVYCHYSINDTTLISSGFLDFCNQRGIALINASPIAMGLLMDRDPPDWHPASQETKTLCKQAVAYCKSKGVDISKLALHFTLREESIATTLISSTSLTRMQQNLDAVGERLTADEEAVLQHLIDHIFKPAGTQSWEGVEIATYWATVGKRLLTELIYTPEKEKV